MTRTGYSCQFMRRMPKRGCPADISHWCREKCIFIDPICCHVDCPKFQTLADKHRRPASKIGVELL